MSSTAADVRRSSPAGCPPSAEIDARILQVTNYYDTHPDSDDRAAIFDRLLGSIHAGCTTPGQNQAILGLARLQRSQSQAELKSFQEGLPGLIGTVVDTVKDAASFFAETFKLLTSGSTWIRVGEFIAGLVLVFMGLAQLSRTLGVRIPTPFGKV